MSRALALTDSRHAWLIACCIPAWASVCLSAGIQHHWLARQPWVWRADLGWSSFWTLWTAPLVNITPFHSLSNLLALAAVGVLGYAVDARPREALALLIAWPLTTLGLLLWPALQWYAGLSGLIHAAAAIVAWRALTQRGTRGMGALLAAGLLIKLLSERGWAIPAAFDSNWGFNVVYAAHLSGTVTGLAAAMAADGGAGILARWRKLKPT